MYSVSVIFQAVNRMPDILSMISRVFPLPHFWSELIGAEAWFLTTQPQAYGEAGRTRDMARL